MTDELKGKIKRTFILAAIAVLGTAALKFMETGLILSLGVRGAALLSRLPAVVFGLAAGVSGLGVIKTAVLNFSEERRLKAEWQKRLSENESVVEEYAKNASDPVTTRKRLLQIKESAPGVTHIMKKCISQLDRMDELQERQQMLLETNDASYLRDTVNTLNQVEQEICLNFRGIVNQCIVSGDAADESKLDMEKVNSALDRNTALLDQSKELLKVSADWIDRYNEQENPDRSLLDSWIRTIRDTIKKGGEE